MILYQIKVKIKIKADSATVGRFEFCPKIRYRTKKSDLVDVQAIFDEVVFANLQPKTILKRDQVLVPNLRSKSETALDWPVGQ